MMQYNTTFAGHGKRNSFWMSVCFMLPPTAVCGSLIPYYIEKVEMN